MPQQGAEGGGGRRGPESDDAESTHYRPFTREAVDFLGREESAPDRSYFSNANSIRMHSQATSWGLAAKIAAPILGVMLVCMAVLAYVVQNRVAELQFNDVKAKAYPIARTIGKFGRILLTWREKFILDHPDYDTAVEWKVGDHWLVTGGFVSGNRWSAMVGSPLDAVVPIERLELAEERASLLNLAEWEMGDSDSFTDHEMVAAYILDLSGRPVAASADMTADAPANDPTLWTLSGQEEDAARLVRRGGDFDDVRVDYLRDRGRDDLMRVSVSITKNAINHDLVGTAVVVMRTDRVNYEHRSFLILVVGLVAGFLALMAVVCWISARRVTKPLRRLTADLHAVADGDLSRRSAVSGSDEVGLLAQAFNSMAERLRVAKMNAMEANRLDSDLAIAKSIQNSLLPPQTPRIRGLDIFTSYRPAKEIGGDYFDFLPVDNQHMGLVIADASGKSIPAALVMSTTRAILRFVAPGSVSAAETLTRVNAILSVDIPRGMFVTAYYLILEPLTNTMVCASAGHNPLLIGRADGTVELINPGGIALGFDQGPIFQRSIKEQKVQLASGDRVLMYTDGVVECANIENEEYSDRRLQEFLRRHRELSSADFVGALLADLDRHRGAADIRDDTTIMTFKVL